MQTASISQLKQQTAALINQAANSVEPIEIMQRSKVRAILVNRDYFSALEEAVMDLADALEAERAKNEPVESFTDYVGGRWPSGL